MVKMGFLSLVAVLCCAHLAYGALHTLQYFKTASSGISNFPEFMDVGVLDGVAVTRYDSNTQKKVPLQRWMAENLGQDYWERAINRGRGKGQSFKANIEIAKQRFNQTGGVHTVMQMSGCQYDDETQVTDGFDQWAYDGEDFVTLDLKNLRYIATTPQSLMTKHKWENDVGYMQSKKHYRTQTCIEWLKKYVQYGSSTLGRKVAPEVSLLPKGSGVVCHATGFYPEAVMITWKKGGVEMEDDVDVGETLPNEDGTFQKRSVLIVSPEEREKAQYSCEVTHKSRAEPINKILIEAELNRNGNEDSDMGMIIGIIAVVVLVVGGVIAGIVVMVLKKKAENEYDKASSQETNSNNSNPIVRTETEKLNPDTSV